VLAENTLHFYEFRVTYSSIGPFRRGKAHRHAFLLKKRMRVNLAVAQEPSSPAAPAMKELVSIEEIFRQVQEKVALSV
jgi:hypothetical protein